MNTRKKVLEFLAKSQEDPGVLCNAIARSLEVTPAMLTPILQEMRREKLVTSEGRTRGTRWSIA